MIPKGNDTFYRMRQSGKMWSDLLCEQYSHTFGKMGINAPYPCLLGTDYCGIKMDDLRSRVYACVRPSGDYGSDGFTRNLAECIF